MYKQADNSISVSVIERLAMSILEFIEKKRRIKTAKLSNKKSINLMDFTIINFLKYENDLMA